jgi:hypothetical protein
MFRGFDAGLATMNSASTFVNTIIRSVLVSVIFADLILTSACSRPPAIDSSLPVPAAGENVDAAAMKIYDSKSLTEVKTLNGLPKDLTEILRAKATGPWIADVGEPCDPSDVPPSPSHPNSCFLLGGISATSALVAIKTGDYGGQHVFATAYARVNSHWILVKTTLIGEPDNIDQLRRMSEFRSD